MAAPFCLEDLAKLKSFVEFVADNPTILNLPELDFFKKLIEKLGGVVPEGTFEMPAGAKCPFFGDVKSESKFTPSADAGEEVLPDMEAESEESEVELDMEANNTQPPLELKVLYIDDKPHKIVEEQKPNKTDIPTEVISKANKRQLYNKTFNKGNTACHLYGNDQQVNDPLASTLQINPKYEKDEKNLESQSEEEEEKVEEQAEKGNALYFASDPDIDYCPEELDDGDSSERESHHNDNSELDEQTADDDEDDEELSAKKNRKKKKKLHRFRNCLVTCKLKCCTRYNKIQRIKIFDFYWHLSAEDKVNFIRQHMRKPIISRIRNLKRGNNCRYYLNYCKIFEETPTTTQEAQPKSSSSSSSSSSNWSIDNLTNVCRKFFESTLGISPREIKRAIEGYEIQRQKFIHAPPRDKIKNHNCDSPEKTANQDGKKSAQAGNMTNARNEIMNKSRKYHCPGEPRYPKPINCHVHCKFKCHQSFKEVERIEICKLFWSLDYNRRKDFILSRIELSDIKTPITPEYRKTTRPTRAYQTKFYLRPNVNSENKRVCKNFMMNTLCIERKFIENAIQFFDKTTGVYIGTDRRSLSHPPTNKMPQEIRQVVLDDISSYPCWIPNKKSKTKYLHYNLSISKMYQVYKEKCLAKEQKFVSTHYYYKAFHDKFRLLFLSNPNQKKPSGFLKTNPNLSHYTGEEAGGHWIDSDGNKLDLHTFDPTQGLHSFVDVMEDSMCSSDFNPAE